MIDPFIEGLARPTGAVPNGPAMPKPANRTRRPALLQFSEVRTARPAIRNVSCDTCHKPGYGIRFVEDHQREHPDHRRYTPQARKNLPS